MTKSQKVFGGKTSIAEWHGITKKKRGRGGGGDTQEKERMNENYKYKNISIQHGAILLAAKTVNLSQRLDYSFPQILFYCLHNAA